MKTLIPALLLSAAVANCGELTQHERDYALSNLHASRKLFLDAVAGLTPEQWNFKAGPDRWSIAECAEHIAVSEDFISGMIRNQMLKAPPAPDQKSAVTDELIVEKTVDRSKKFTAPEPIAPTHRWTDPAEAVAHFKESRDKNIAFMNTTTDEFRQHFFKHPAFGVLDAYQWFLLLASHTERHTLQILEVKADPNFPK